MRGVKDNCLQRSLSDSTGEVHAMLLVKSMPFFAFHENNLKLIAVLAAHGIDHLRFGTAVSSVARFIAAFDRVYRDYRAFGLDAVLLRLSGSPADVLAANEKLRSSVRAIDLNCIASDNGKAVAWALLPLTDSASARAWMQRVDSAWANLSVELFTISEIDPHCIRSLLPRSLIDAWPGYAMGTGGRSGGGDTALAQRAGGGRAL